MSAITAAQASNLQQAQLLNQVSTAIAAKTLDVAEQQGAAALSLLEDAAQFAKQSGNPPGVGQNLDVTA